MNGEPVRGGVGTATFTMGLAIRGQFRLTLAARGLEFTETKSALASVFRVKGGWNDLKDLEDIVGSARIKTREIRVKNRLVDVVRDEIGTNTDLRIKGVERKLFKTRITVRGDIGEIRGVENFVERYADMIFKYREQRA